MMLSLILLFSYASLMVTASQAPIPGPVCEKGPCEPLSEEMGCSKWDLKVLPSGRCCEVCTCIDHFAVNHDVKDTYITKIRNKCYDCTCIYKDRIKQAKCFKRRCAKLDCLPENTISTSDGCCRQCIQLPTYVAETTRPRNTNRPPRTSRPRRRPSRPRTVFQPRVEIAREDY